MISNFKNKAIPELIIVLLVIVVFILIHFGLIVYLAGIEQVFNIKEK